MSKVQIEAGDCLEVMARLINERWQFNSIITDPPYHLGDMTKRFGADGAAPPKPKDGAAGAYHRSAKGFLGHQWDGGGIAFDPETWRLCFELLPPGGHLLAFSGTKTYHRMTTAIEAAGFEIRNMIPWIYGTGFPKSHAQSGDFEGWGTDLKPAIEPIALARKPLAGTVKANLEKHRTGALNIEGCRVDAEKQVGWSGAAFGNKSWADENLNLDNSQEARPKDSRFPANVIHDGSPPVMAQFPITADGGNISGAEPSKQAGDIFVGRYKGERKPIEGIQDSGSAGRFFYVPKPDAAERELTNHPTVKPVDLMAYLCRLVTPPGGIVLDPFAGSGSTGLACLREGFDCILIEREPEYLEAIERRLNRFRGTDTPLFSIT